MIEIIVDNVKSLKMGKIDNYNKNY